jgi:kynureninase
MHFVFPIELKESTGRDLNNFKTTHEYTLKMDKQDPLGSFRKRFYLLPDKIYMDGNSLGVLSPDAESSLFNHKNPPS